MRGGRYSLPWYLNLKDAGNVLGGMRVVDAKHFVKYTAKLKLQ